MRRRIGPCIRQYHSPFKCFSLSKSKTLVGRNGFDGRVRKVLPTASGKQLKAIIESGVTVGISSRGVGNGEQDGDGVLVIDVPNFRLLAFDIVADPSTHGAYQKQFVKQESFEERPAEHKVQIHESIKPRFNPESLIGLAGIIANSHVKKIRERMK